MIQAHTEARVGSVPVSASTYASPCEIDRLGTLYVSVEYIWLPFLSETLYRRIIKLINLGIIWQTIV